jgi:hypothetical protein
MAIANHIRLYTKMWKRHTDREVKQYISDNFYFLLQMKNRMLFHASFVCYEMRSVSSKLVLNMPS